MGIFLQEKLLLAAAVETDKGMLSANIVITGLVVVFAVLLVLILCIRLFGTVLNGLSSKQSAKKREPAKAAPLPSPLPKISAPVYSVSPTLHDGNVIPEEIIAVISAAVMSVTGGQGAIRSIRESHQKGVRPAWSTAGLLESTRPF